ncbi:bifunctional 4-hydroxy-2-oxoglutarate aldolase/2-dehydro-3-deoxy-phosphogluconate aldolase [Colwellia sp. PAMC 21821]|uniref:bifunctional 4-hydroxy-2-oxoglutarate aldolase/2-dehydro-3-deoxy-phosphogluconate aldolase n=1 Tax=Colwellia sp. PAMC 21821 TaxID=1816219 RepID=UPI0009C0BA72|nr:bifunctional 4-hydroxy-2-oxoglutarate aldolase/2-dehydro-3-deoxy-phosphogluconate aldolase [Colwellia sp. PAMC 21821]ARD45186.1 keto-deoxy-phosphogluconate aldolase [Colwellia sp. PAMC 21821]
MTLFSTLMGKQKLLPIIQADSVSQGLEIAKAMATAGIGLVEVVLRTQASIDIIKAIKLELPDLKVGAGTVLDADILQQALAAGSDFIITPTISSSLLTHLAHCKVPVLPGVSNSSDILLAREFGYTELKLFPASLSGGAPFLKAMGSVFKDISFCPTGGINEKNQDEFLSLTNVFAVGGTWIANPEWVANEEWSKITAACKAAQDIA